MAAAIEYPLCMAAAIEYPLYMAAAIEYPLYMAAAIEYPLYMAAAIEYPLCMAAAIEYPLYMAAAVPFIHAATSYTWQQLVPPFIHGSCSTLYTHAAVLYIMAAGSFGEEAWPERCPHCFAQ